MPELAAIKTDHFECVIWTGNIADSQQRLNTTLSERGKPVPVSVIKVSPPLSDDHGNVLAVHSLGEAVFFENRLYDIEFVFAPEVAGSFGEYTPVIEHRLKTVEEAFHFSTRSKTLRGSVHTGNDIGWFTINLVYQYQGKTLRQSFSFEVIPTKMDMDSDIRVMNQAIEDTFPLWRYSLAEKTSHQASSVKKPHSQFLLLWLAQFETLNKDLFSGLKHIVNAPHSRLVGQRHSVKMGRLKGKLSPKLEESVIQEKRKKNYNKRFIQDKKILDVDTPENRFIKAVINHAIGKLGRISQQAFGDMSDSDDKKRVSNRYSVSFASKLDSWQLSLRFFQRQPFFGEVGKFKGLQKESLVLQQKPGYSKVYKVWQQLKWYLDILDGESNLSLRNVAEMYEVWCFLEIRRILLGLGFVESAPKRIPLVSSDLEVSMKDGMAGSFHLERNTGRSEDQTGS